MQQYQIEITDEALADMEHTRQLRRMLIDNYSVFYVIEADKVIVTNVLYSASDIGKRLTCKE